MFHYNEDNTKTIPCTTSRSGLPCLAESGGGYTNTGTAQIIANTKGAPKKAIHVPTSGDLACNDHAIIPVQVGDYVVEVDRHRDRFKIAVGRITGICENELTLERIGKNHWHALENAIDAGVEKSQHYHCRVPYYINQ